MIRYSALCKRNNFRISVSPYNLPALACQNFCLITSQNFVQKKAFCDIYKRVLLMFPQGSTTIFRRFYHMFSVVTNFTFCQIFDIFQISEQSEHLFVLLKLNCSITPLFKEKT